MTHGNGDRRIRLVLAYVTLPVIIAAAIIAPAWVNARQKESERTIQCTLYAQNATMTAQLAQISRELGLPGTFPEPQEPEGCAGWSP